MTNPDTISFIGKLSLRFRRRRMERFAREFRIGPQSTVLDIGGAPECWRLLPNPPRVVLLNIPMSLGAPSGPELWVGGDGCRLPFRDGAFDIVFSNSVIEHVGAKALQEQFASEAARVGRAYWVQTPNRWFPIEQHLFTPLIHWLPKTMQRAVVPRFNLWRMLSRVTPDRREFYIGHFLKDIRLVGPAELRRLFPAARIVRERFLGLTKSLIAVKR